MTICVTKIWWDLNKDKLVEQVIPESEIYKREWVKLTDEEIEHCCYEADSKAADHPQTWKWTEAFARAIEAKLKEKNT